MSIRSIFKKINGLMEHIGRPTDGQSGTYVLNFGGRGLTIRSRQRNIIITMALNGEGSLSHIHLVKAITLCLACLAWIKRWINEVICLHKTHNLLHVPW